MKKLKLFFALFAMLALGVGNAWGAEVSFDATKDKGSSSTGVVSYEKEGITLSVENGALGNGTDYRVYKNTKLTITSSVGDITNIALTYKSASYDGGGWATSYQPNADSWTSPTASGEQARITKIVVTYTPSGSGETPEPDPDPTPDPEPDPTPDPGTGGELVGEQTATYVVSTATAVTTSGIVPDGSSASLSGTGSLNSGFIQCTNGKNHTLTLKGYAGYKIKSISIHVKSNSSKGTGSFSVVAGSTTIASIAESAFNTADWNGSWNNSGVDKVLTMTNDSYKIQSGEDVKLTINCKSGSSDYNSLYIKSYTIVYESTSTGGETPDPVIVKTLKSIAVTGMKITYEQGDIFKFNGICTATYSVTKDGVAQADETVEVTPTSVSTPNMNTVGTQTITVTYETVSTTYDITINENEVTPGTYNVLLDNVLWNVASGQQAVSVESMSGKANDITFYTTKGSSQMYANTTQTRFYKDQTFTISVPEGYLIKSIIFAEPTSDKKWDGSITVNTGTYTDGTKTWTGSAQEVTYTFGAQNRIANAEITYEVAPVEPTKTLTSIEITTPATQTTFWQGETFNYNGLVVTAHYSDAADEVVTPTVTGSTATAGTATVNVSYKEQSTSYTITVKAIPNTKETAYTIANAYDIIDKLGTASGVFISGIISQVESYNSTYKSITYWISADGTTTKQLQVYSGKGLESADFAAVTDLSVGDQVIVCGNLKKFSGTYEFDKNNYLASHTPTTKDPAGLAYATTSYTANVGEPFTTPELTNPHNLVVTYSTSDASKATVDVNTGAVTIVAAGEVTITASTTGNATHDAGSASYTITISNPAMAVATLPFTFNRGKADIDNTAGMTQEGLGSDYSASSAPNSQLKFDGTGDWVVIRFDSEPEKLSYDIKNNSFSGGTFSVQESADGETYTDVAVHTTITDLQSEEYELNSASRYVKFIYTTKSSGNVGLGNIKITKFGEEPEQPGEGGGEGTEQPLTDWVLTSAADITINDLVVITMTKEKTTWAMTNDQGTSAAPVASEVTVTANALAEEPNKNLKWVVSNDNGTLTIYPYEGYETWLYSTTSNNGIRVGTNENKTFKIDDTYGYLYNIPTERYVGVYNNADWRSYTSMHANISDQTLKFFVKKNANDILPGTGEDPDEPGEGGEDPVVPTVNPTATFIFNTTEGLDDLGIIYPATADEDTEGAYKTEFVDNATYTQDGITMTTTNGTSNPTRVWLTKAGKLDLRIYNGASLTLSVGKDLVISNVVFTGKGISNLKVDGVAVSNNSWAGSKQSVTFDVTATTNIYTIAITVSYTRSISANYGTICLPYGSSNYSGAEFYEFVGKETGKVWLASVDKLDAGVPYVFMVKGAQLVVAYEGTPVSDPSKHNGLHGTFTDNTPVASGNYIISKGKVLAPCGTDCYVNANRAYVVMDEIPDGKPTQQMPGRKYIGMDVQGENEATGVEDLFTTDAPIKVIENGQLIIIRDGVKYNVQGQKL